MEVPSSIPHMGEIFLQVMRQFLQRSVHRISWGTYMMGRSRVCLQETTYAHHILQALARSG